jgi:hypothetical protein
MLQKLVDCINACVLLLCLVVLMYEISLKGIKLMDPVNVTLQISTTYVGSLDFILVDSPVLELSDVLGT